MRWTTIDTLRSGPGCSDDLKLTNMDSSALWMAALAIGWN